MDNDILMKRGSGHHHSTRNEGSRPTRKFRPGDDGTLRTRVETSKTCQRGGETEDGGNRFWTRQSGAEGGEEEPVPLVRRVKNGFALFFLSIEQVQFEYREPIIHPSRGLEGGEEEEEEEEEKKRKGRGKGRRAFNC